MNARAEATRNAALAQHKEGITVNEFSIAKSI